MTAALRVLVVADNLLVRTGLATLLATRTDLQVVGQVASSATLADDLDVYRPQVVIVDLGYEPAAAIARLEPLNEVPFVALLPTAEFTAALIASLDENAIYGVMLRDSSPDMLAAAINAVFSGLIILDPLMATSVIVPDTASLETLDEALTPREAEVLQLLAEGLPNKNIAGRLGISPNTVKFHINAILNKLGVQSRTEAVIRATRLGLVIL